MSPKLKDFFSKLKNPPNPFVGVAQKLKNFSKKLTQKFKKLKLKNEQHQNIRIRPYSKFKAWYEVSTIVDSLVCFIFWGFRNISRLKTAIMKPGKNKSSSLSLYFYGVQEIMWCFSVSSEPKKNDDDYTRRSRRRRRRSQRNLLHIETLTCENLHLLNTDPSIRSYYQPDLDNLI